MYVHQKMKNSGLIIFWQNLTNVPVLEYRDFGQFLSNFEIIPIKIVISNLLHNISTGICIRKNYKMKNSFWFIFGEIWPTPLYYSTGTLAQIFE